MDFFNVVNEAQEAGVPDVKIRLYYQNNKAEMAGPAHLNPCLSTQSFYTCCTVPNMGVPVFYRLCFSGLLQLIY